MLSLLAGLAAMARGDPSSRPPHIIFLMADDLGFNDVGYSDPTVKSPNIDALASAGVKLGSVYTWNWCAPSRGAMLSGRYAPFTGYEQAGDGPKDDGTIEVFPLRYPLVSERLLNSSANYTTVMIGKWHLGYATPRHTPEARGFMEYLGYLTGAEDYYTHKKSVLKQCPDTTDLWRGSSHSNGTVIQSRPGNESRYFPVYSTLFFTDFITDEIRKHPTSEKGNRPFFAYASYQSVHGPLEVPKRFFDLYEDQGANQDACQWAKNKGHGFECANPGKFGGQNCYCNRLLVKAQVAALDEAVGNITDALKDAGMWESTVFVFMGDNGGPTFEGHSNTPLRGGKLNFFEGGVRPAAFVSSPLLPQVVRGTWYNGSVHETDWAPTFLSLAGLPIPEVITGQNFWPTLLDPTTAHRSEVLIADHILRMGKWKLVVGAGSASWEKGMLEDCMLGTQGGWLHPPSDRKNSTNLCPLDIYTKPPSKASSHDVEIGCWFDNATAGAVVNTDDHDRWLCSNPLNGPCSAETPCLWDVEGDVSERHEVAAQNPAGVAQMVKRLRVLTAQFEVDPPLQGSNDDFCDHVQARGGFLGPWMP
jgi:arylsulfatase A-like enzyme